MTAGALAVAGAALALGVAVGVAEVRTARTVARETAAMLRADPRDPFAFIPENALLVVSVDLARVRGSPLGAALLQPGREVEGVGPVQTVCGFDPVDRLRELTLAVPEGDVLGEFGLVGTGDLDATAFMDCASSIVRRRGGEPVVTVSGPLQRLRDGKAGAASGEIAVGPKGPVLFGGGAYVDAMASTALGHGPSLHQSASHAALRHAVGLADVRATIALRSSDQQALDEELRKVLHRGKAELPRVTGLALGVSMGSFATFHGAIACEGQSCAKELEGLVRQGLASKARDPITWLLGLSSALERVSVTSEGTLVHIRVDLPNERVLSLYQRLVDLIRERKQR